MPSLVSITLVVPIDLRHFPLDSLGVSPGPKVGGGGRGGRTSLGEDSLKYQFHSEKAASIGITLTFSRG